MNIPKHQSHTNKTYKSTITKDTNWNSSREESILKGDFEGIVKSKSFETKFPHYQPQRYIKSIRKMMILFPEYQQYRLTNTIKQSIADITHPIDQQIWKFTMAILVRFGFSYETIALGLSFYIKLTFKKYFIDQRARYLKKFHLSGCIYLSAKSIEMETKIPRPSDYQYFCGQNFTSQDYNKFQKFLIIQLEYDLQKSTLLTFLNFYLSIGVFYQTQIQQSAKQISELQNEILQKGLQSLKKCQFLENEGGNPEYEAIRIIKETRNKYNLTEECKIFRSFSNKDINYQVQRKRLSSSTSFSNSMGNLLHFTRDLKFFTQRQITQASTSFRRQHQKEIFVSKNKFLFNDNLGTIKGSCVLRRKRNAQKNGLKKEIFDDHSDTKVQGFKYVALKDRVGLNCKQEMLRKQLIKCKSASFIGQLLINGAIKYQRNNIKQNSQITTSFQQNAHESTTVSSIDPKSQMKTVTSMLKSSKSVQYLSRISLQCGKHTRKLSKLEEQNQERMIEKMKYQQDVMLKEQSNLNNKNASKYFNRKNNSNNNNQIRNKRHNQSQGKY